MWWSTSSGRIELNITKAQAKSCTKPGVDALPDVQRLMQEPKIKRQLRNINPELVSKELREYGAWSSLELSKHPENLERLVWLACGDIAEGNL